MRLNEKAAVITGGGRGIGRATCIRFAQEGAAVVVADVDEESAKTTAGEIEAEGGKARPVIVDVTDKASVKNMIDTCLNEFGKLNILINNAGINRDTIAAIMREDQWDQVINVNLKGTFLCCQAGLKPLRDSGSGRIINTSSIAALGNIGQSNYAASKGGVISLTKTLALEFANYKITVNCVAPGATMTPMFEKVPDNLKDKYRERIPLKRFADPGEIAAVHLFLASDEASYITGQTIFIDGGISVGL